MGTTEEALIYLKAGFYLSLTGFLCKVSHVCFSINSLMLNLILIRINPRIQSENCWRII